MTGESEGPERPGPAARLSFETLVEHSPNAMVLTDAELVIRWVSPAVTPMLGWEAADVVGRDATELIHTDDLGRVAHNLGQVVAYADPEEIETLIVRIRHKDGGWRHLDITGANLLHDPQVGAVLVNLRDVTLQVEAQEALARSEEHFRALAQHSSDSVFVTTADGLITYASPAVEHVFGYGPDVLVGHRPQEFAAPDTVDATLSVWGRLLATPGASEDVVGRIRNADGEWRWVEIMLTNLLDRPAVQGIVVNLWDVTTRIEEEQRNGRLLDIISATTDLVAITDRSGALVYANDACRRFFGIDDRPLARFRFAPFVPPWAQQRYVNEVVPALREKGLWSGEAAFYADDVEVPFSLVFIAHRDEHGHLEYVSSVGRDISERKEFEATLEHQATHDPLTGLPNRALLLDRLEVSLARAERFGTGVAVLFLDLDHFKVVNDSLGHARGDQLLIAAADRLKEALRQGGDTVARFGGDEFVILCEDLTGVADAERIALRIGRLLGEPFRLGDDDVFVTASTGIAFTSEPAAATDLLRDADAAMYQAKERGRDRHEVFDRKMRAEVVDRLSIENSLRKAIDRRELRIHYQPKVDLRSGAVIGAEALVRWEHPDRGLLLPGEFIRVAEESGLIVPIGRWVLEQAIRQGQRWQAELPGLDPLYLCINLSRRQLSDPHLVDDVARVLDETGVDPGLIDLEITESVLMDDVELAHRALSRLHALGVKLVVDDFGTGYSSLSYLQRFPVDLLKIDRSFVAGLGVNKGDTAIVSAVLSLAHALGMQAIAEGVETPEQLAELRRLGCDMAQGYFLARPQPAQAVADLLARHPRF
ncbi:MAG: EAL domain-containing protein [Acidimicrobiales bacterium]|nr:EAL domain-containing protein [Acidimicrobiales bacterium]MCB1015341.1 EAL domain-containing protein [Acidimicrobiales bacterium]MCB9373434.1 EAL domain-containing protein [Microthrixaceae bacterium]